jgi:carnosine N-methyltransferase
MLHTANYILNATHQAEEFTIHPFCHTLSNVNTTDGATREIRIPDVLPAAEEGLNLSMATGDFLEIYREDKGELARTISTIV